MNRTVFLVTGIMAFFLIAPNAAVADKDDFPDVTVDGLHRVPDSKLALVYAEPGADLSQYTEVKLLEAYVAFKKNWARDQRQSSVNPLRVTSKDVETIKNTLAKEFYSVFKTTLEEGGYQVVDQAGDNVLLVRPAIINLDVNAPDTPRPGRSVTYTRSAGEMTLYIELYDSVTGDLIAKAMDRRIDNQNFYTWTNSVTNRVASEKILKGWASILLEALDEARAP